MYTMVKSVTYLVDTWFFFYRRYLPFNIGAFFPNTQPTDLYNNSNSPRTIQSEAGQLIAIR